MLPLPRTRWGKPYCFATAPRKSFSVTRPRRSAASPNLSPSTRCNPSTRSMSAAPSFPSSARMPPSLPFWRAMTRLEPSIGNTFSWAFIRLSLDRARQRIAARGPPEPGDLGGPPCVEHTERRHVPRVVEVVARAHPAVRHFHQDHRPDAEHRSDDHRKNDIEADLGTGRLARHDRRVEHGDIGLVRAAFALAHDRALHGSVIGPLGRFHVAPEQRELVAILLQPEHPGALLRHGFHELRLALAALARRALDAGDDLLHFCVEFLAQALNSRELALVLRMVAAVLR